MSPEPAEGERYAALLGTMQRLVREPDAERAFAADPRAFLASGAAGRLSADDVAGLTALGANRLFLYRRHVRKSLARAARRQIPRAAARLGDAFDAWVERWIEAEAPRSRYFRDVAFELVAWAAPRWAADPTVPSYLGDLARHELFEFEVATAADAADATGLPSAAPAEPPAEPAEIDLARAVRFDPSARLARYAHAVHRLDAAEEARDVPEPSATALFAYRDAAYEVRFLELTPLAAAILERLLGGEALGAAVTGGAAALASPVDAAVTFSTAALLEDLRARGALLGGA